MGRRLLYLGTPLLLSCHSTVKRQNCQYSQLPGTGVLLKLWYRECLGSSELRAVMGGAKEKLVCNPQPEQVDLIRRWREALEGNNKDAAYDLMNQMLDGKISQAHALASLDSINE